MTRRFAVLSIAMLLALPMLAGAQPTPIPPEAARQTPLTPTGN